MSDCKKTWSTQAVWKKYTLNIKIDLKNKKWNKIYYAGINQNKAILRWTLEQGILPMREGQTFHNNKIANSLWRHNNSKSVCTQ